LLEQRGVRLRYVLDEGGGILDGIIRGVAKPVALVAVAERGCSYVELKVDPGALGTREDYEGHGSMPHRQTTIGVLSNAIAELESHPMAARIDGATGLLLEYLGPEMPFGQRLAVANQWLLGALIKRSLSGNRATNAAIRTTMAITMVRGGASPNALPGTVTATVNVRLLPGDRAEDVLGHIRQTIGDDRVQVSLSERTEPSPVADVESADFNVLHRTIREVFPGVVVAPGLTAVTTDSRHYDAIADNTFRFIPIRVNNDDLRRIHGTDERIAMENYLEIVRFFIQYIRNSTS
jgi:carboxypeptidase PM20D1